jgi:hypothetical protein
MVAPKPWSNDAIGSVRASASSVAFAAASSALGSRGACDTARR